MVGTQTGPVGYGHLKVLPSDPAGFEVSPSSALKKPKKPTMPRPPPRPPTPLPPVPPLVVLPKPTAPEQVNTSTPPRIGPAECGLPREAPANGGGDHACVS